MRIRSFAPCAALLMLVTFAGCSHAQPRHAAAPDALDDRVPAPVTASVSRGAWLYAKNCAACHGARGALGRIGPQLIGERKRRELTAVIGIIKNPDPPMPKLFPATLRPQDVADIAAFVETL